MPTSITQRLRLAKNPTQRVYILRTGLENGEDQWLEQLEIGSIIAKQTIQKHAQGRRQDQLQQQQPPTPPELEQSFSSLELDAKSLTRSRSEEKGVYVAGMLKIGEKKLFIVVNFFVHLRLEIENSCGCFSPHILLPSGD